MNDNKIENSLNLASNRNEISNEKMLMGSTSNKHPVFLNDGRTVVFISDKSREAEIRLKYELLKEKKITSRCPRHY
ncbi:MAG: hypothetical protein K0B37_08125 [Bacteroidales bacterium]|nr:hypothetical protein [Bacteroidales bacterium]